MESDATLRQAPDAVGREGLTSRRGFLRIGTAAGAGPALALALAACGKKTKTGPPAQQPAPNTVLRFGQGDVGVLNYLLAVEHVQVEFYETVRRRFDFSGRARSLFKRLHDDESEHVELMESLVNQHAGDPSPVPRTRFDLGSRRDAVRFAGDLEELAASAFLAQVGNLQDEALLDAVLAIHAVEARQAAALAELAGRPVSPDGAFARPRTQPQVLERIDPLTERRG